MFSPFCSDLFKYLLGAPWTLLKPFSHRVLYLYFTCTCMLYILCLMLITLTECFFTVTCNFIMLLLKSSMYKSKTLINTCILDS